MYHVTVEDVTDHEDDDDAALSRSSSSLHQSYSHFDIGEDPFLPGSSPGHQSSPSSYHSYSHFDVGEDPFLPGSGPGHGAQGGPVSEPEVT